jgi:hypothetical protein
VSDEFVRRVTADHYVFCGNGGHGNPQPSVVETYFRSRRGSADQRAVTEAGQDADREFTFWFSTNSSQISGRVSRGKFEKLEAKVTELVANSTGFTANFNQGSVLALELPSA